jgi:hypothetical protein
VTLGRPISWSSYFLFTFLIFMFTTIAKKESIDPALAITITTWKVY